MLLAKRPGRIDACSASPTSARQRRLMKHSAGCATPEDGCSPTSKNRPNKIAPSSVDVDCGWPAALSRRWRGLRSFCRSPYLPRALDSHFQRWTRARVTGAVILGSLIEIDRLPLSPRRPPVYMWTTHRSAVVELTTAGVPRPRDVVEVD